jgi:hypothetical protein
MRRKFLLQFPLTNGLLHKIISHFWGDPLVNITTATATMTEEQAGKIITMNRAAGCAITLPAAIGSGNTYEFIVGTTQSGGNAVVKVANATDVMVGQLETATTTGATTNGFCEAAGGTDDTVTMNGTTTGGIAGSRVICTDFKAGVWYVEGHLIGSGTLATSLSATV